MNVSVHGITSPALTEHVNTELAAALIAMESRVSSVIVTLEDNKAHNKGENKKRCHMTVNLKQDEPIVVDEANGDLYNAVSKAATRLKNVINRKHDKRLEKLHGH